MMLGTTEASTNMLDTVRHRGGRLFLFCFETIGHRGGQLQVGRKKSVKYYVAHTLAIITTGKSSRSVGLRGVFCWCVGTLEYPIATKWGPCDMLGP